MSAQTPTSKESEPFKGFKAKQNPTSGGKQVKKRDTGRYKKGNADWYIKSSQTYPADDISEVVTSKLMVSLIGEERAVPYQFITHQSTKEQYVGSEIRKGGKSLAELIQKPTGLGWTSGWLGSNPRNKSNKEKIHRAIEHFKVQEDMANILATCLLLKEEDCQVENIIFYPTSNPNRDPTKPSSNILRACKFDDGWGLANICRPKNKKVNLFGQKDFFGSRGTHKRAGIPTNHFIDYPDLIHSEHFTKALRNVAEKSEKEIDREVDAQIKNITDVFKLDDPIKSEQAQLKALENFAKHIGLKPESSKELSNKDNLTAYIKANLKETLQERAKSMKVLAALLDFKMSIYPTGKNSKLEAEKIKTQLQNLLRVIKKNYPHATGKEIEKSMPPVEPNLRFLLERASNLAKKYNFTLDDVGPPLKELLPKQESPKKPKESITQKPESEPEPKKPSTP